jgi:hypothetical protein
VIFLPQIKAKNKILVSLNILKQIIGNKIKSQFKMKKNSTSKNTNKAIFKIKH